MKDNPITYLTDHMMNKSVKVQWIDSCASNMGWTLLNNDGIFDGDVEPIKITTYGVVIQETDDFIIVAQNIGKDPKQVCSLMTIPKGCIKFCIEIE